MLTSGVTYRLTSKNGKVSHARALHYDGVQRRHVVQSIEQPTAKPQAIHLGDYTSVRRVRSCTVPKTRKPRKNVSKTRLYILKTAPNVYKVGCSDDVDKRMQSGRTWCSMMEKVATRAIPSEKSQSWRTYEHKLKTHLVEKRCSAGGTEVFCMNPAEVEAACAYLRNMKW